MFLNCITSRILLVFVSLCLGCKQVPPSAVTQGSVTPAVRASIPAQPAAPHLATSLSNIPQASQLAAFPAAQQPKVEDVEERKGPFTIKGETFTVVLHSKRLLGQGGDFEQTLASLEIVDSTGVVQHREEFPYAVEDGRFEESCEANVNMVSGSNGAGFL